MIDFRPQRLLMLGNILPRVSLIYERSQRPLLMTDAFPRSRTIAFNDEEDERPEHEHQPRGFSSAREAGFMPRSGTIRTLDSTLPQLSTASPRHLLTNSASNPNFWNRCISTNILCPPLHLSEARYPNVWLRRFPHPF
jgi:hypothetical protein